MCHSLGGLILKQALCVANSQLHRYEYLVNSVAGIVFISTPHACRAKEETFKAYANILKALTKKPPKTLPENIDREAGILQDLAHRFESFLFNSPILSVYETKETKYGFGPFKSKQVVSPQPMPFKPPLAPRLILTI